jgi:hypothetical protein
VIEIQNVKMAGVETSTNTAAQEKKFDTKGASYLSVIVVASEGDGTAFAEQPTLTESDAISGTYTAITDGAMSGLTSPTSPQADSGIGVMHIDLRGRKRFIKVDYTAGVASDVVCLGLLSRQDEAPITSSASDFQSRVIV